MDIAISICIFFVTVLCYISYLSLWFIEKIVFVQIQLINFNDSNFVEKINLIISLCIQKIIRM